MTIRITRRADSDLVDIYMIGAAKYGSLHAEHYFAGLKILFSLL